MKRNFGSVYEQLTTALLAALQGTNAINRYMNCARAAESAIARMKEMVLADPFPDAQEEIHHFKYEAPFIYSELFYYLRLIELEHDRLHAHPDRFRAILIRKEQELDDYFLIHKHITRYDREGASYQDEHLFLRRPVGQWSGYEIGAFIPPDFTIGTYWLSWIMANERLQDYVREELAAPPPFPPDTKTATKLPWTTNKSHLIVLLYVLHLGGCFNKNSLKEVMEGFGELLDIDLGQYHSALNKISFNKDPAAWLKTLPDIFLQKLDSLLD